MPHKWAKRLHHTCLLQVPQCFARGSNLKWPTSGQSSYITPASSEVPNALHGEKLQYGPQVGIAATSSLPSWVPNALHREKFRYGPQVGNAATSPLPSWGSPMLCTEIKSEMAHKWAKRLHHPCLLGGPQCSARRKIEIGPTSDQSGCIKPAFMGVPNALHGDQILYGPQVGKAAASPQPSRGFPMFYTGIKSEMANKWAKWLHHPCLLGGPQCSARGKPQISPTSGQSGYITPAFLVVPNAVHGEKLR